MISLYPLVDTTKHCPFCNIRLETLGCYIPGMHTLADLRCKQCEREYFSALPAGHGLYHSILLEKDSAAIYDSDEEFRWFSNWIRTAYAARTDNPRTITVEEHRPIKRPLLLNCLDTLYGHALLKLLNAQYYLDQKPDFDLIVLISRSLRWLVPDDVAAIWTVDLPLKQGTEWNDNLALEIRRRLESFPECWLSIGLSHPHSSDFAIERFTGVTPFAIDQWADRWDKPTVTFIWRNDRLWRDRSDRGRLHRLTRRPFYRLGLRSQSEDALGEQYRQIAELAGNLRQHLPDLDFAVAGIGQHGRFPEWITDLRVSSMTDEMEKTWCHRYARSHVVVGIHGSNMLLPSAHAGGVVELMPPKRWVSLLQDLLLTKPYDARDVAFRHRVVPSETSVNEIAHVISSLIKDYPFAAIRYNSPWIDHQYVTEHPHEPSSHFYRLSKQLKQTIQQ